MDYFNMRLFELLDDRCNYTDDEVSIQELRSLESQLDTLFGRLFVDVELTGRHFLDRINDDRNYPYINICELKEIFKKFFMEHQKFLRNAKDGFEGVITDINTNINMPFIIKYDPRNKEFDLIMKTIMRKKDFKTSSPTLKVNSA